MAIIKSIVPDELKESIQTQIDSIKRTSRGGVDINMSTVIRYSLEKYLEEQKELDQGVITLKFNVDNLSFRDLERLEEVSEKLSDIFSAGYEDTIDLVKNSFKLDQAIKYKLYKENLNKNNVEIELTEEEKEILKKYSKNKEVGNE